jgi:hypothetical protein
LAAYRMFQHTQASDEASAAFANGEATPGKR